MAAEEPHAGRVREALAGALGEDPGDLELIAIPGGASRETWLVEAEAGKWVLRRDPPGAESFVALEVEQEVVSAAARAGVPVPRVVRFEAADGAFGTAGYLMQHVEGESVAPRVLRRDELAAARGGLAAELGTALAAIHAIDAGELDSVARPDGDPALAACAFWEAELDAVGEPLPATEAGLRWLRLNAPSPPERMTLVHGDFRLGNFIVSERGLSAVIDWELCHLGDPAEDIAWLCVRSWRFGNDDRPVAGLGEREEFLAAYEVAGGTRPEAERLRWWEAMGNAKWAVICARQAHDHLTGRRRSAELASLGRRICEPEWDLLELIGEPA
jgi:aminoglycoside phosphotransferase (APT) family kinase protein